MKFSPEMRAHFREKAARLRACARDAKDAGDYQHATNLEHQAATLEQAGDERPYEREAREIKHGLREPDSDETPAGR